LEEAGIEVNGDIVTVDNYNFTIDRENLKILTENGESNIKVTKEVKRYLGKNANGKYEAQILVTIESDKELENVIIENPDKTTLELETKNTKIQKDMTVEFDKEYKAIITTKEGKAITRTIIEKSQETIRTPEELVEFRDKVNSGLTYEGKTIKQLKNINLAEVCSSELGTWIPIGFGTFFYGTYDGDNNAINNLYINNNEEYPIGLFGKLAYTGKVENLTVTGHVERTEYAEAAMGGVVGRNEGIIENVTNKANVISLVSPAGGIVGNNLNRVEKCINSGNISATEEYSYAIGGICGVSNGNITSVNISEDIQTIIKKCKNTSEATITGVGYVGGILGEGMTKINIGQCYNAGTINGESYVGGIAGSIENEDNKYGYIGNCYNTGNINATSGYAGGLIGKIASGNKELETSYSIGKITCPQYAGGVVGENNGILNYLYYLNKGGVSFGCGLNNTSYGLVESAGSTQEKIKSLANIFNDYRANSGITGEVWKDDETNINNGYPILKWQVGEE
ncbi:MAG: hypothetical protein HFJ41_03140, partial [Clostridia bacterium]|nr:hypothetical protein [Clostridia bacterium]